MNREEAISRLKSEFVSSLSDIIDPLPDIEVHITAVGELEDVLSARASDSSTDPGSFYNTATVRGYVSMPEKLALWTVHEEYISTTLDGQEAAIGSTVKDTFDPFSPNPFTDDYVNLYTPMETWRVGGSPWFAWDDNTQPGKGYIRTVGKKCDEVGYLTGFRRAPIPTIPYMVDTFTPMPTPVIPPGITLQDVYNEGFISSISVSSVGCESIFKADSDGSGGVALTLDLSKLASCLGSGTATHVLGFTSGGMMIMIPVEEC